MMSGSVKYVVGAPVGPKSRGGLFPVVGGAIGPAACARARRGAITAAPAAAPMTWMSARREMGRRSSRSAGSGIILVLRDGVADEEGARCHTVAAGVSSGATVATFNSAVHGGDVGGGFSR